MATPWFDAQDKVIAIDGQPRLLLALAERRGGVRHTLLRGTGIFEQDLQGQGYISPSQYLRLIANVQRLAQGDDLPFLLGHRLLSAHCGGLAQLLLASADLRQALLALARFRGLLQPLMGAMVDWSAERITLRLLPVVGLGNATPFVTVQLLTALAALIRQQVREPVDLAFTFNYPKPRHLFQYEVHLGTQLCFDAPATSLSLPRQWLQRPWPNFDPQQQAAALALCRAQRHATPLMPGVLEWVVRWQRRQLRGDSGIDAAAAACGLSTATFKRHLQRHGVSYQQLGDSLRKQLALHLLATDGGSNEQLARQLGYSDAHNFRRSCKRWTGLLPSALRRS